MLSFRHHLHGYIAPLHIPGGKNLLIPAAGIDICVWMAASAEPVQCNDMLVITSGRTYKVPLACVRWQNAFANGALYTVPFLNWVKSHIILYSCYASYHSARESYSCTILHLCPPGHCHLHFIYNLFSKFI